MTWLSDALYPYQNDDATSCTGCDQSKTDIRTVRGTTAPSIHYGLVASANQVLKNAHTRNQLTDPLLSN
ncbi:hypothetical protein BDV12DRAFT_179130 [Aspergillus spectabilis]